MIDIVESKIKFKAPQPGQETKPCKEHYNGRRVLANIDGNEELFKFKFKKDELPFDATEEDIEAAVKTKMKE